MKTLGVLQNQTNAKADCLTVQELGFVRGVNVLGVDRTAEDIWTIPRISYPTRSSPVEDGIVPSIDGDGEAILVDS